MLQKIVEVLKEEGAEKVYLFGSRANGTARPDSDYDIMMIKKHDENKWHEEGLRAYRRLIREVDQPLDFIMYSPEKFEQYKNVKGFIIYDAFTKGRLIYEHKGL